MNDPRYSRVSLRRILCTSALALGVGVLPAGATTVTESGPLWGTDGVALGSLVTMTGCRTAGTGTLGCPTGLTDAVGNVIDFSISWTVSWLPIVYDGGTGLWKYDYVMTVPNYGHQVNHAIIGLTPEICLLPDGKPNHSCVMDVFGEPLNSTQIGQFDPGNSLPGLPNWIVGARFVGSGTSLEIEFYSPNEPVWGDFYGKGVQDAVWNIGLGDVGVDKSDPDSWIVTHSDDNPVNFIVRPDGTGGGGPPSEVPEPASLAMVGGGLLALAYGLRKFRRS